MKNKTPAFWYRKPSSHAPLIERLLAPIAILYGLGHAHHQRSKIAQHAAIPIICIGNLNAGGTGKTPASLAMVDTLRKHNLANRPHYLLRGYGGGEYGPIQVDLNKHNAWDTGDEALLLAEKAPTIVSADRAAGALMAQTKGADIVVMDDGLQNPGIYKDVKFIVVNGNMGFGNGKMMPAGPLREPLESGLARADAFILIGKDRRGLDKIIPKDRPVFKAHLVPDTSKDLPSPEQRYVAFAGLGYPKKFFRFLRNEAGLNIAEDVRFGDHYPYQDHDMEKLLALAEEKQAKLITTPKDYLRIPEDYREHVEMMHTKLAWEDEAALAAFLKEQLATSQAATLGL